MANQENLPQTGSKSINPQDIFSLKKVQWKGPQYEGLKVELQHYLSQMTEVPSELEVLDLFSSFQTILSLDSKDIEFNKLTEAQKLCISMIYASDLYIDYLSSTQGFKTTWEGFYGRTLLKEDPKDVEEVKGKINFYLDIASTFRSEEPTPPLKKVFNNLTQTKDCSMFILEWFFSYLESKSQISFDYKTFNNVYESIAEENYERFCDIVYNWNKVVIHELSVSIDILFPLLLFIESNLDDADTILYNVRKEIFSGVSPEDEIIISPITIVFLFIISYIFDKNVFLYLTYYQQDHSLTPFRAFISKDFMDIYNNWIEKEIEVMSNFFRKNFRFCTPMGTLEDTDNTNKNANNHAGKETGQTIEQLQELGSGDETGNPPEEKPKRHLSVGHDIEAIKKLATYLVEGFTNTRGSLPALVSSNDEKNITINKLIFLFTGNKDYSFDGKYNLTWNAERVYLKLLIKLLHNLNELATGSHAVVTNRADYISDEYIKCKLKGGVWPKVAEAFENIKSEATIRNADYRKNYKDTTAPINQKRLRDMKVIADLWLKCKNDIDF